MRYSTSWSMLAPNPHRGLRGQPAQRPSEARVDTANAHPQDESNFWTIPAELRNRIYEYVFGSGTIHISSRPCKSTEKWLPYWSAMREVETKSTDKLLDFPEYKERPEYEKTTYAICKNQDWDRVYAMSKTAPDVTDDDFNEHGRPRCIDFRRVSDKIIDRYGTRHMACGAATADFAVQDYARFCCGTERWRSRGEYHEKAEERCGTCKKRAVALRKQYGAPTKGGLLKLHEDSKLHLDILLTCRRIYDEASLLPYSLFVFDVTSAKGGEQFANHNLTARQAMSVETIHLDCHIDGVTDLLMVLRSFPKLKKLQVSAERSDLLAGDEDDWDTFYELSHLKCVEVVMSDEDSRIQVDNRLTQRVATETIEKCLMSSSLEEADEYVWQYNKAKALAAGEPWEDEDELEAVYDGEDYDEEGHDEADGEEE